MSYTESLYVILGVHEEASQQEIKQAYKKAALRTHPDRAVPERKLEAETNFKKVAEAYEILSEPASRNRYNLYGTPSSPPPMSSSRARGQQGNSSSSSSPNTYFGVSPDSKPFSFQWESSHDSARRAQAQRGSGNRRPFGVDPFQLFNEMFAREFGSGMGGGMGGGMGAFDEHPFFANHQKMANSGGFGFGAARDDQASGFGDMGFGFDSPFSSQGTNAVAATRRGVGQSLGPYSSSSMMGGMMGGNMMGGNMMGGNMMGASAGNGNFQSESRSSRTINGRTETVVRKVDAQGNETVHTTSPEGQRVHVNGVEQPTHPLLQG
ncbi:hypothetical protein CBS101457_005370 [Exobasidium rhododendri]|nr:hypothetical protein CBS101457_005370 [Exobasidium rhododendri]